MLENLEFRSRAVVTSVMQLLDSTSSEPLSLALKLIGALFVILSVTKIVFIFQAKTSLSFLRGSNEEQLYSSKQKVATAKVHNESHQENSNVSQAKKMVIKAVYTPRLT